MTNQPHTPSDFIREMSDPASLTRVPEPDYRIVHASSYDRRSVSPGDQEGWFANEDKGHYIRKEENHGRDEYVMAEFLGPGCLCRLWTADRRIMPRTDHRTSEEAVVRIYLDGNAEPVITGQFHDIFNGTGFFPPPYAHKSLSSAVSYFPVPFAHSMKMTLDTEPLYYNITARIYEEGTRIESFEADSLQVLADTVRETGSALVCPTVVGDVRTSGSRLIRAGEERELAHFTDPGAIAELALRVDRHDATALRGSVLRLEFDNETTAYCPVGEFFGSGPGLHPFNTFARDVDADGRLRCRWMMPYQRSARVSVLNLTSVDHEYALETTSVPYTWDARSMYFHAAWRYSYPIHTRPFSDWNYVTIEGQGRYVGDTLTVYNPVDAWWGEGDEKIWVDDDSFPSIFGTGTEDYYGYSWGGQNRGYYEHPMHAQVRVDRYDKLWTKKVPSERSTKGVTTEVRNLVLDSVTFRDRLQYDMEIWHWEECDMAYSAACFWYALPGSTTSVAARPDLVKDSLKHLLTFGRADGQ